MSEFRTKTLAPRLGILLAFASALVLLCGALVACGNSLHQVITASESCTSCHSEDKQTYEIDGAPASATMVGSSFQVNTSADKVYACTPTFTSEDGSTFVPRESRSFSVENGTCTVELNDGAWALCTKNGEDTTAAAKLVYVDSSQGSQVTVEL